MKQAVEQASVFFQMGLMRRFDKGYVAAKNKIERGVIGTPLIFKATSREPYVPSPEYLAVLNSGGIFIDMGIHDFDLALWLSPILSREVWRGVHLAIEQFCAEPSGDCMPPVTMDDGIEALRVSIAATRSYQSCQAVEISTIGNRS